MPEQTENQAIITTAQEAVEPHKIADGLWLTRTGYQVTDLRDKIEAAQANPDRTIGKRSVVDVPSFAGYLAKHSLTNTELWGSRDGSKITAIINATAETDEDNPGIGGWEDHTCTLRLTHSDDWKEWSVIDGKYLPQVTFAEFVEDHLPNFQSPNGAEMLELAQTFRAASKVDFSSSQRLKSGATALNYTETTEAKAGGTKGSIDVPDTIALGMRVYDGGQAYPMTARLRYRINGGDLVLGIKLDRPRDVLQAAFDGVVADVQKATDRTVWATA